TPAALLPVGVPAPAAPAGGAAPAGAAAPAPAKTGNAGLPMSTTAGSGLAIALAGLAVSFVAGARAWTNRSAR
ncbi:MAG: hypothetical protein WCI61_05825, partial [Chloroflexota bacterium]